LERLASEPTPRPIAQLFCRSLDSSVTADLVRHVDAFNALDPHQLPIANVANCDHPTYNKYGMSQRRLLETGPLFPERFLAMPWGEAELLVKVLAELLVDRQG
jgi:glycyl-tRNA synthetase alpha subunit